MTVVEIISLVSIVGTALGVVLVFIRGRKSDEVAAESGLAIEERMSRAEVQGRYESLVDTYQEDTKSFRDHIKYLDTRLETCQAEREKQRIQLNRMLRKYGENGPEEVTT